jgi:hypothetical protein
MEVFLVYLWLKLDTLIGISVAATWVFVIAAGITMIVLSDDGGKMWEKEKEKWQKEKAPGWRKLRNQFLTAFIASIAFWVFMPSSKETAILVGASIAVDVAKSPEGAKVATLLRGKANELLDEQINKLKKETK